MFHVGCVFDPRHRTVEVSTVVRRNDSAAAVRRSAERVFFSLTSITLVGIVNTRSPWSVAPLEVRIGPDTNIGRVGGASKDSQDSARHTAR